MNAVIAVFNSLSVRGRSRYTADFAAPHRSKCTATFRTRSSTHKGEVKYIIGNTLIRKTERSLLHLQSVDRNGQNRKEIRKKGSKTGGTIWTS
jgi:hypothetical protein